MMLRAPSGALAGSSVAAAGRPRPIRAWRAQTRAVVAPEQVQAQEQAPCRVTGATIRDVQSMYQSLLFEYDYDVDPAWVEGTIPSDLVGTYVRNGPGLQVNTGKTQRHTFDGDGMILSFCFPGGEGGGAVRFKNKFVRTKGFVEEQAVGRPLFRTAFSRGAADGNPLFNPFDFNLKNCANTGVLAWAGKLLALYESGLPHELDPASLSTVGESTVGGQLETPVLAAHYRVTPRRNPGDAGDAGADWVAFSSNTGLGGTELIFYEFGEEAGGKLRHPPVRAPLPGVPMALVHDIAVSEDYYVVHVGPLEFSPGKFVTEYFTSRCAIAECLRYNPDKPSKVWLVPRPGGRAAGQEARVIEAPATFVFHHANAFQSTAEDGRQLLTLDTVAWDTISFEYNQYTLSPEYYRGGARSQLRRMVFDLTTNSLVSDGRLLRRCAEFPSVSPAAHGAPHRHVYACADIVDDDVHWGPAQSVVKVTVDPAAGQSGPAGPADAAVDSWSPGPRCIVNEPIFVPRQGATAEDDGYVLVTVHNAATGKGDLAILDARQLAAGPVATIHLPHLLPAGLHGSFSPEVFHEAGPADPKWAEPNAIRQI
ncbi:MAG: carotenoid oxygenase [Monoraphidium minutum]|nr:MAG: carotenoid oxygenase [Monoraphidium minutum]